jgi:hypothetical protein
MRKKSSSDRQFIEDQKLFRKLLSAQPLLLMRCLIRRTLRSEALVLEEALSALGLSYYERETIYKELSNRREALEADLCAPRAYDRLIAEATVLGLLSRPSEGEARPAPQQENQQAEASAP